MVGVDRDGHALGVQHGAGLAHPAAVDVPVGGGVVAVVLPNHQVVGAVEGHLGVVLVVHRGGDGEAGGGLDRPRGADDGAVDVVVVGRVVAVVVPGHQEVLTVGGHRRVVLVGRVVADDDARAAEHAAQLVDQGAVDVIARGLVVMVGLPDHQEVGAVEGHRRVPLVVGGGVDGDPLGVLHHALGVHQGSVDVAVAGGAPVLPDNQVVARAVGHHRAPGRPRGGVAVVLVALGLGHCDARRGEALALGVHDGAVDVPVGELVVAPVAPDHQVVGAVVGHVRRGLDVGRQRDLDVDSAHLTAGHEHAHDVGAAKGAVLVVLPDDEVLAACVDDGRGVLVVGALGDGDARLVLQHARGADPRAVDVRV